MSYVAKSSSSTVPSEVGELESPPSDRRCERFHAAIQRPLTGTRILVTGIVDGSSLALAIARELRDQGAELVCTGLGRTAHHAGLSARATSHLEAAWASFEATVREHLGDGTRALALDATLDESIEELARTLGQELGAVHGVVHSIALDRTIRGGRVKPLLDVTREEFLGCMDVSAYSLVALVRSLLRNAAIQKGAAIVSLSYLGAARVPVHPYKNVGVAKAALERITLELAAELGPSHGIRVNAVRFSPFAASRAGGAIEGLAGAVSWCEERSPLGNARPQDLALEVAHLLRPEARITAEIRHVDGGYHALG